MIKDLYGLMLRYGFKPDHKLDQNFCVDDDVIKKVISLLEVQPDDVVLEIGPGLGFLTKELVTRAKKVIAIEKDPVMVNILKQEITEENLEVIEDDFLNIEINKLKPTKIVGFIPYSISQEIMEKINATVPSVIVVQREYAEKLTAFEGYSNYVAQSVLAQSYGNVFIEKTIKRNAFYPVPPCESAVVGITPKEKKQDKEYNEFVKEIFRYPNKDLGNALSFGKKEAGSIFNKIDESKLTDRVKTQKVKSISVREIKEIYKKITSK